MKLLGTWEFITLLQPLFCMLTFFIVKSFLFNPPLSPSHFSQFYTPFSLDKNKPFSHKDWGCFHFLHYGIPMLAHVRCSINTGGLDLITRHATVLKCHCNWIKSYTSFLFWTEKGSLWKVRGLLRKVTSQGDLTINSSLGSLWLVVMSQAYNFFSKRLIVALSKSIVSVNLG